jgi:hypothetical protein
MSENVSYVMNESKKIVFQNHMFLGLRDPDPLVRGMDPDPDPSIILLSSSKIVKKP